MTTLVVDTSEGVRIRLDLAGAGSRFAAGLLDLITLGVGSFFIFGLLVLFSSVDPSGASAFVLGLFFGGLALLGMGYHILFHAYGNGATPGKRALGIRVVTTEGQPPSIFQLFVRALLQPIDAFLMLPISIGLIVIAATPRNQRLGDLVAGTMVVRNVQHPFVEDPFPGEKWSTLMVRTLPLTPGVVGRLSPDERSLLRAIVTRRGLIEDERRALFVESAKHFSERLGLGPFADARDVLKELYLFVREFPPQQAA
ncbi:MAG: RDD family protein [Planctomycetes bacterium]|nr:RDD family protein [Planctomycetota bacterium]